LGPPITSAATADDAADANRRTRQIAERIVKESGVLTLLRPARGASREYEALPNGSARTDPLDAALGGDHRAAAHHTKNLLFHNDFDAVLGFSVWRDSGHHDQRFGAMLREPGNGRSQP
jgi:hypothetical protein